MIAMLLNAAVLTAQVLLGLAMLCALWRATIGPRAQDRILAVDTLYVNAMLLVLAFGVGQGSRTYFEVAFVIAAIGFVSTAALAKFLMRGEVIE
jgi:multicomponent K+:H+ antiporter subunit F